MLNKLTHSLPHESMVVTIVRPDYISNCGWMTGCCEKTKQKSIRTYFEHLVLFSVARWWHVAMFFDP
jgi:hypothetical protein